MHDDDDDKDVWDDDDEVEGLFEDKDSIFAGTEDAEPAEEVLVAKKKIPVALVAVFDQNGQPLVARHRMENGKPSPLEDFRQPNPDEYNSIMFNGKIVRGGVVAENVSTATNLGPTLMRTPLGQTEPSPLKKAAMYIGGIGVLGAAGYFGWRWWRNREED